MTESVIQLKFWSLIQGLFLFFSALSWAGTEGAISGRVLDPEGSPRSGIRVQLFDGEGRILQEMLSSEAGSYGFFPIPFGKYKVSLSLYPFSPVESEVELSSGETLRLDLRVEPFLSNSGEMLVEVKASKRMILNTSSMSETELDHDQIAQLPQGLEVTLPKLIATTTPGVVLGPFGQMFIRGNHANIQYQIDGVQLPESPSGTFGQAISPRNIDKMEVITGGLPAEYGQRLSAVVNIMTKSGPEKPEGEIELNYGNYNTITPHLLYGGSNNSGNLHYFISTNYNQTQRGLETSQPTSTTQADQGQGGSDSIHNLSRGHNEFIKLDWLADNQNKFSLILYNNQNNFQIPNFPATFSHQDPFFQTGYKDSFGNQQSGQPTFEYRPAETNDTQSETNAFAQVVWKHTFSERSFLQFAPYYKYSLIAVGNDPQNDLSSLQFLGVGNPANSPFATAPGSHPISQSVPSSFAQNRHINNLGLKGDYLYRPNDIHLIKTGFQFQVSRSEGWFSIQTDLNTPASVLSDPNTGTYESLYLQDEVILSQALVLNVGIRFDAVQFSFSNLYSTDYSFQPRAGFSYLLTDTTKLHVFYGKLFQPAPVEAVRAQFNSTTGSTVPLQVYDIKAEKADFTEIGIDQQFLDHQIMKINAYYKDGFNILDDTQLLNTSIAQPYNFEKGFAYGVEFTVKGQLNSDWAEYFNYSYEIAKGQGVSGGLLSGVIPASGYQYLDHVQEHTFNTGLTYSKNSFWWTHQWLYGSGLRTGENNSLSLPSHFTLDTTFGYQFHGSSWMQKFKMSLDIINVFDQRYPITIANGFNGSHYASGRMFIVHLIKEL